MTCYVVSADQALEDYRFIHQYEVILTAAFLVGMAILLWYLLRSNFLERRALLRRAQSDPLTGLMNQAGTRESITDWLADGGCNGALLMLDLDHFKHVTRSGMKSSARPPRSCRATSGRGILSAAWGATNL